MLSKDIIVGRVFTYFDASFRFEKSKQKELISKM